jgi:hypothetical protein
MKNIVTILTLVFFLLIGLNLKAQNGRKYPILQERVLQAKLHELKTRLNLDDKRFDQFRPIYMQYNREMLEIDYFVLGRLMKVNADSLSAEEANRLIQYQLESVKKLISIREKYYKEFLSVLSPQDIIKLYQTEAEMHRKVLGEIQRRRLKK